MTTPTHQPSETDNFCSSKHPHEPAIKPQLDAEGRCLICGLLCQIDMLALQLAEAKEKSNYWQMSYEQELDLKTQLTQQLAEANEKCDGFKLYYEQLGAICDSDKLAIMSLQQQLATANATIETRMLESKMIEHILDGEEGWQDAIKEMPQCPTMQSAISLRIAATSLANGNMELQQKLATANKKATDDFIDNLITTLKSHGIDATNWDGDDAPHIIVANGIVSVVRELEAKLATAIAERDFERRKLSSLKLKILTNHVAAICKCGGELTAVGCAHCNLREAVVLATEICNSKLFDENREAVESILEKSIKYKEHLDATTL